MSTVVFLQIKAARAWSWRLTSKWSSG